MDCEYPTWDWFSNSYRVKPEEPKKKVLPYESAEEFLAAQKEHGPYLSIKGITRLYYPLYIDDTGIEVTNKGIILMNELINYMTWQDGHICGKEIEE